MRTLLAAAVAIALAVVVAVGLATAGGGDSGGAAGEGGGFSLEGARAALAGAPAPLASLHGESGELLEGGAEAFEARLAQLEDHPVVVNKWASWCGPCRAEFPFLQSQSVKRGKQVAFIGVNTADNDGEALRFLGRFPVPYPHYKDPDSEVAEVFGGVRAFPTTAFYDSKGELAFLKQGGYATEAQLAEDIERYAR